MRVSVGDALTILPGEALISLMLRPATAILVALLFQNCAALVLVFGVSAILTFVAVAWHLCLYARSDYIPFDPKNYFGGMSLLATLIHVAGIVLMTVMWYSGSLLPRTF